MASKNKKLIEKILMMAEKLDQKDLKFVRDNLMSRVDPLPWPPAPKE